MAEPGPGARQLAEMFHDRYERLAPSFGYETRLETRAFDPTSKNGRLMIAVCDEILTWFDLRVTADELVRLRDENEALRHSILHPVAVVVHPDETTAAPTMSADGGKDIPL